MSSKPSSIINRVFDDEFTAPKQFRVKRTSHTNSGSREDRTATRRPTKGSTGEAEQMNNPSTATTTTSDSASTPRSTTRSLSPGKLRRNVMETVSPMLSPVMKGLRRFSKTTLRSPSPMAARRLSETDLPDGHEEGETDVGSATPRAGPLTVQRSQSATEEDVMDVFAAFSQGTPKRRSNVQDFDVKPLFPPSKRFIMESDDNDDDDDDRADDENQSRTMRPLGRSTSPSFPPPTSASSTTTSSQNISGNSSLPPSGSTSSIKPLSWSSHHSKQKPRSSSSAGSGDGNSSAKKPSSASSADMPPRPKRPSAGDESSSKDAKGEVDRRAQRRPYRRAEESSSSTNKPSSASKLGEELPGARPQRARSATPHRRSNAAEESSKGNNDTISNRAESMLVPSAASTNTDTPRRQSSGPKSGARRHRSMSREPNPEAPAEIFNSAAVSDLHTSPERREKPRRTRSRSRETSAIAHVPKLEIPTKERQSSKNRPGAHRRSGSSRRHHSAPHSDQPAETGGASMEESSKPPKALRRGKKRTSQPESSSKTKTISIDPPESPVKPSSSRSIGRQRRSQQHAQAEDAVDEGTAKTDSKRSSGTAADDKPEKPDAGRRPGTENIRKNLDRETLEHVKNLKDEIKQMRVQRRKVKFGENDGTTTSSGGPMRSTSDGEHALKQPDYSSKSTYSTKASLGGKYSQPNASLASMTTTAQSNYFQNSGTAGLSSNTNETASAKSTSRTESESGVFSKLMAEFNSSIGAISIEDLDMGFLKSAPPVLSEQEQRIANLRKQIKKTKKFIKRTIRDVWTEREEITALQRKNWSIRKALMQNEGPPDSLTTLNMKIEKLLRQEREIDLESDRMHEEKDALEIECVQATKAIGEFKDLFDKLNKTIVPLLPPPENAPEEVDALELGAEPVSPLASPSGTNRQMFVPAPSSDLPTVPTIEGVNSSEMMEDSIHSTEEDPPFTQDDEDEEGPLSLSHLRMTMSSA